jgi:hypothetical protein
LLPLKRGGSTPARSGWDEPTAKALSQVDSSNRPEWLNQLSGFAVVVVAGGVALDEVVDVAWGSMPISVLTACLASRTPTADQPR